MNSLSIEQTISKYYNLKIEFIKAVQCFENCDEQDKDFYYKIVEEYAIKIRELNKDLKDKYNLKHCCSYTCLKSDLKP
jgi:hypothetical protein